MEHNCRVLAKPNFLQSCGTQQQKNIFKLNVFPEFKPETFENKMLTLLTISMQ